jgi:nucleotide-binding universal stress UspA family protein
MLAARLCTLELAWNETRLKEAKDTMAEFVSSHLPRIPVVPCVLSGDAAKIIVEHAHTKGTELIVVGTHGVGGFRRMLLGSITAKVLDDARCPVFTSTRRINASHTGALTCYCMRSRLR